ncbi:MAG: WecB/TagA/CpsF family glycosyltransferase [Bacteroidetes bacterium]|nr:WecB/TagA/CpsF family glycosyltransferase [Bacteroidota bacterium]
MNTIRFMGYTISASSVKEFAKEQCIINTINPHSYYVAKNDAIFKKSLQTANILLPDGSGIVWATRILLGVKIKRIAGADIHLQLLEKANNENLNVFYLGSSENTLSKIKNRIKTEFPNIKVSSYSPPFKPEFSENDNKLIIEAINSFKPDILFVGMTAPKQEKWVLQNKERLKIHIISSIGAVFDFYSGNVKRSSQFWINIGLEGLPRFFREPRRLWKRLFISFPLFFVDVFKTKLGLLKF